MEQVCSPRAPDAEYKYRGVFVAFFKIIKHGEETLTIYTRLTLLSLIFIYSIIFVSLDVFSPNYSDRP